MVGRRGCGADESCVVEWHCLFVVVGSTSGIVFVKRWAGETELKLCFRTWGVI